MVMSGKELVKLLRQNGWVLDRIEGSHHTLVKDGKIITVPVHDNKSLPKPELYKLLRQAGLR